MMKVTVAFIIFQVILCLYGEHVLSSLLRQSRDELYHPDDKFDGILTKTCCQNPFIFVKRYEKGFFNQINAYLSIARIAMLATLTHVAPNFVSNYLETNLRSRAKPCSDHYSNQSILMRKNRDCALDVPFEDVIDLPALQRRIIPMLTDEDGGQHVNDRYYIGDENVKGYQTLPSHCLLAVSQAERLCSVDLQSLPQSAMFPPTKHFLNCTTFADPKQTYALREWIYARANRLLYLHGRYARNFVMKVSHDDFKVYRLMRQREVSLLQPGPLLKVFVQEALGHELLRGGYNALHLRLEKDMLASFMVDGWTDKLSMDFILAYLHKYLPIFGLSDCDNITVLPLYVAYAGELPGAYRLALERDGFKVVTKADLWPEVVGSRGSRGVLDIESRELLGFFEFQMFVHASVFIGMSRSSLTLYAFERRSHMTHRHHRSFPSLDFLTSPETCCMAGMTYDNILTLNAGQLQLARRYRVVFVDGDKNSPKDYSIESSSDRQEIQGGGFISAVQRAIRRMGHYTFTVSWAAYASTNAHEASSLPKDDEVVDLYVLLWSNKLEVAGVQLFKPHAGATVAMLIDWTDDRVTTVENGGEGSTWKEAMVSILQHCHFLVFPTLRAKAMWLSFWSDEILPLSLLVVIPKGLEPAYYFPSPLSFPVKDSLSASRLCSILPPTWGMDRFEDGIQHFRSLLGSLDCSRRVVLHLAMHAQDESNPPSLLNDVLAQHPPVSGIYIHNDTQIGRFFRGCDLFVALEWGEVVTYPWLSEYIIAAITSRIPVVAPNEELFEELIQDGGGVYERGELEAPLLKDLERTVCRVLNRYENHGRMMPSYDINDIAEEYIQLIQA